MSRPQPPTSPRPASLKDAYKFFVPLMFMAELMFISHAVISAFLARMADPEPILAAYSISFYMHATLGSPVWALQIVAVSYIRDKASIRRLGTFSIQVVASIAWLWLLISFTSVGDWLCQTLFGASAEVTAAAKLCMFVSFLVVPLSIVRSFCYGLLMVKRRTMLVTYGTAVRLIALTGILWALSFAPEHAVIGVLGLGGCILVETLYAVIIARPFYRELPESSEPVPSHRELWRFSWPVMLMQTAESGVAFTTNFFLGRLLRPELAIAAFGVLDSLVRVLLSPLRNLTQTCQALVRQEGDARVVAWFGLQIGVLFALVMCSFLIPEVQRIALEDIMGVPTDMATYIAPALALSGVLALCMAGATLCRGLLIASRRTGALAVSSGLRIVAVAVVGLSAIAMGAQNGAVIGISALTAAFAAEFLVLGGRLLWGRRKGKPVDKS